MKKISALHKFVGPMLLLAIISMTGTQARAADELSHDAVHGKLTLNNGQKWVTDAPLRLAMSRISEAVDARLPAIHADTLDDAAYVALGKSVDGEVVYMINNCKLPSDADAMLHLVLADIMQGSAAMQGKAPGTQPRSGAVKVVQTLRSYGQYFDHPGWKPPAH